jgi:hypothetical protein
MAKKGKKNKRPKLESFTDYFTVTLPEGLRLNINDDVGTYSDEVGELSWWMTPTIREHFDQADEDAGNNIANALSAVAIVAHAALITGRAGVLESAMRSVIMNAESTIDLFNISFFEGADSAFDEIETSLSELEKDNK